MDRYDGLLLAGVALIEAGVWQWSRPAALVLAGVVLVVASLAADLRARVRSKLRGD